MQAPVGVGGFLDDDGHVAIAELVVEAAALDLALQRDGADVVFAGEIDVVADIGDERELLLVDLHVDGARMVVLSTRLFRPSRAGGSQCRISSFILDRGWRILPLPPFGASRSGLSMRGLGPPFAGGGTARPEYRSVENRPLFRRQRIVERPVAGSSLRRPSRVAAMIAIWFSTRFGAETSNPMDGSGQGTP